MSGITAFRAAVRQHGTMGNEHKFESDECARCNDAGTIVIPTGEIYKVCAPEKWKSYDCAVETASCI